MTCGHGAIPWNKLVKRPYSSSLAPSSLGPDVVRLDCMKGKGVTCPQGKVGCSIKAQWGVSMWGQLSTVKWENAQAGPHPELRSLRVSTTLNSRKTHLHKLVKRPDCSSLTQIRLRLGLVRRG